MASLEFNGGKRSQKLAYLIVKKNLSSQTESQEAEDGMNIISCVTAPCLAVSREMVIKAYFNGKPEFEATVDMLMDHLAMKCSGKLLSSSHKKLIVCDDDSDKAMSLRYKVNHQADIAHYSEKLGISRNDFVIRAIEHFTAYLSEIEEMEE